LISHTKESVSENGVMSICGPRRGMWWEAGEDYIMGRFITCRLHQIWRRSNEGGWHGQGM